MTLWRMEWARLVRTPRLAAVMVTYLFFGLLGPVTARYLEELIRRFGQGVSVDVPAPVPVDGIVQYTSNAQQIGLLVALGVAAGAVALDANTSMAAFLRTRVGSAWRLLLPRFTLSVLAAGSAFTLGTLAAWYQTSVLLGPLPAGGMVAGIAYGWLYLAFAVAIVTLAAAVVRGRSAAVILAVVVLLSLPVLGLLPDVRPWLPSHLVGALDRLAGGASAGEFTRAGGVTVVVAVLAVAGATRRLHRREI